jgi:hypothetical protein
MRNLSLRSAGARYTRKVLAVTAGLALAGLASASTGTARAAATPRWQLRFSSLATGPGVLTSAVAFGPRDAWAAGAVTPPRRPTSALVLRWNGASWTRVRLGRNLAFGPATVAGSSPSNVWLFGSWLMRWDGRHWHKVPAPAGIGAGELSPVVLGPANVWMYGLRFDKSLGKNDCVSTIWHWNGRRWRSWSKPRFCATGLAAASATSMWLVGDRGPGAQSTITALRWNGKSWVTPAMPHPPSYNALFVLPDITAGSAGNVWIGDDTANSVFPQAQGPGFALRWTGHRWIRTPASPLAANNGIATNGHGLWMGPDAEWTGHGWVDTTPAPSFNSGQPYSVKALARIPGSETILAVGTRQRASSSAVYPMIASYGPLP